MKKAFLLASILCWTLILSGCSFYADFVVINKSEDFVQVIYEATESLTPKYANLKEFDNSNGTQWREMSQDRYKIDNEKRIIEVNLAPNEVLLVRSVDASWVKTNPYEALRMKTLKVIGKEDSIELEGNQVFERFEPQKLRWVLFGPDIGAYVIDYK